MMLVLTFLVAELSRCVFPAQLRSQAHAEGHSIQFRAGSPKAGCSDFLQQWYLAVVLRTAPSQAFLHVFFHPDANGTCSLSESCSLASFIYFQQIPFLLSRPGLISVACYQESWVRQSIMFLLTEGLADNLK